MNIYLAGPMTGLPDLNADAFNRAARQLRDLGNTVFNPTEENTPDMDYRAALATDLEWLTKCADAIALLPGWHDSPGATAEFAVAKALRLDIIWVQGDTEVINVTH